MNVVNIGHTIDTKRTNKLLVNMVREGGDLKLVPANARKTLYAACAADNGLLRVAGLF